MKSSAFELGLKARFPLQPYRTETWKENATFRYGTVGVENGLKHSNMSCYANLQLNY